MWHPSSYSSYVPLSVTVARGLQDPSRACLLPQPVVPFGESQSPALTELTFQGTEFCLKLLIPRTSEIVLTSFVKAQIQASELQFPPPFPSSPFIPDNQIIREMNNSFQ